MNIFRNLKTYLSDLRTARETARIERSGNRYTGYIVDSMTHFESTGTQRAILESALDAGAVDQSRLITRNASGGTEHWIVTIDGAEQFLKPVAA